MKNATAMRGRPTPTTIPPIAALLSLNGSCVGTGLGEEVVDVELEAVLVGFVDMLETVLESKDVTGEVAAESSVTARS